MILLWIVLLTGAQNVHAAKPGALPLTVGWEVCSLDAQTRAASGLATARLAVLFLTPAPGWHTYSNHPGPMGKPTRLSLRAGSAALPVLYPPGTAEPNPLDAARPLNAYRGRTPLFVPLPAGVTTLAGDLDLLLCTSNKCLPAKLPLRFRIPAGRLPAARSRPWWPKLLAAARAAKRASAAGLGTPSPLPAAVQAEAASWAHLVPRYAQPELEVGGLAKAILFGALAGFILNFMPCVLPVISIKLSSLAAGMDEPDARLRRRRFREHNFCFAAGMLLYFLLLGVLLGATGLAWGQMFQNPAVVLILDALIFALGLSLFGVFTLPVADLKIGASAAHPRLQALFTGFWATLLATPCSGPFLGGVLGWTLLRPFWIIGTVFAGIGFGMALPYLILGLFPSVVRAFPKPGPWTGVLEKSVGLLLMGTCVYLLSLLPSARLVPALALLWFVSAAAWLWGTAGPGLDSRRAVLCKLSAAVLLAAGLVLTLRTPEATPQPAAFDAAGLRQALGRRTVVVDFTADWCPSCKALEQTTLKPARLRRIEKRYGLLLMRADLSGQNPQAEGLLHALGSQSIPLLVIFPKNAPDHPLVLRDLFTPAQLETALQQTARP